MYGYMGKILRVNLSEMKSTPEPLNESLVKDYIGGRGMAARMLYDEVASGTPPFDPRNKLFVFTGPLVGTISPISSGCAIVTKSPLTGIYLCTFMRGHFPPELKSAGYDGLIIEGKAETPTYVYINDDQVEFRKADHLNRMCTDDTERYVREEIGDCKTQVMCIGPAGENLVKYACIIADKRACGRGGAGAVMGSKNLKAVAVRAQNKVQISNEPMLKEMIGKISERVARGGKPKTKLGSANLISIINEFGSLPTRNFQGGVFERYEEISAEALNQKFVVKIKSCPTCPIACGRISSVREGPYAGAVAEGPEYETLWAFGPQCGVASLEAIIEADMLCDKYGLDTMSAGVNIGFAMELFERGIIGEKETEDRLVFGNDKAMINMLHKIAYRQGFGDILAEGVRVAAERIGKGAEKYAMHVKGMELAAFDPRGFKGMGLNYATGPRGACHNRGFTIPLEAANRFETKGKGEMVKRIHDMVAVGDSTVLCAFGSVGVTSKDTVALLLATTGITWEEKDIFAVGERILNVERLFNVREGMRRKDDTLPQRFLTEPMPSGPSKDQVVDLQPMIDEYYKARGWDEQGIPTQDKLRELRLESMVLH